MAQLNPSIILAGRQPDFVNTLARSTQAAGMANDVQQANALAAMYRQHGPGIAQGDQQSLNALAQFDPQAALGVQDSRQIMDIRGQENTRADARLGLARNEDARADERLQMAREVSRREAERHIVSMNAVERAQEAEKLDRALAMGSRPDMTEEEWDQAMRMAGADDLVGQFEQRDVLIAGALGVRDALAMGAPPEPQSPEGKLQFDIDRGLLPETAAVPGMFVQVTGQEAADRGLDPNKTYNIGPDNKATEISGGGVNVTTNVGGGDKVFETLDKSQGEMFSALITEGMNIPSRLAQIDQLESYLGDAQTPEGLEAAIKVFAGDIGIPSEGLDGLQAARAIISALVPQQRPPGSGTMSDGDVKLFMNSLPRLINTREGNLLITRALRGMAKYQAGQAQIAAAVANRQMTPAAARKALYELENPLERFRGSGETTIGGIFDSETQSLIEKHTK